MQVRQADRKLEVIPDSQFTIDCDMVVPAIGQSPLTELLQKLRGVEVRDGRIVADRETGQTGNPRYFAGGDCVNGGREVVDAVADGKRAAMAMLRDLAEVRSCLTFERTEFCAERSTARIRSGWPPRRPPTRGEQIMRAFDAGWGGAVWKTIGEPIVNVSSRYSAIGLERPAHDGLQQYRAHQRPAGRSRICARWRR